MLHITRKVINIKFQLSYRQTFFKNIQYHSLNILLVYYVHYFLKVQVSKEVPVNIGTKKFPFYECIIKSERDYIHSNYSCIQY